MAPILEIGAARLRPLSMDDAAALHVGFSDPGLMTYWSCAPHATLAETARFSRRDAERLPQFQRMQERAVALLRNLLHRTPPTDLRRIRDLFEVLRFGKDFRALPLGTQHHRLPIERKAEA